MRIVSYARNSGGPGQGDNSLTAQHDAISAVAGARGWAVVAREDESISSRKRRPALERCIEGCKSGKYDALVVAKLDRVSRSTLEFLTLVGRASKEGWTLICLQPEVDMTSPYGRTMATVAAAFADLERDLISQRTKEGIAARRAAGVQWGRRRTLPQETVDLIHSRKKAGETDQAIADYLNGIPVPTATGKTWDRDSVRYARSSYAAS
jgi:DNA invertase Pin-like site-specific DNA recombinase